MDRQDRGDRAGARPSADRDGGPVPPRDRPRTASEGPGASPRLRRSDLADVRARDDRPAGPGLRPPRSRPRDEGWGPPDAVEDTVPRRPREKAPREKAPREKPAPAEPRPPTPPRDDRPRATPPRSAPARSATPTEKAPREKPPREDRSGREPTDRLDKPRAPRPAERPGDRRPAERPPRDRDRPDDTRVENGKRVPVAAFSTAAWSKLPWRSDRAPATGPDDGDHDRSRRRTLRTVVTVMSVLVFALSGTAWAALSGSISTSGSALDGPVGDAADGATDILLVGVDSRTDAQGQGLPPDILREIGASAENGVVNTDTMILVRIPNNGSRAVAFSIPRDSYVSIPGEPRRDKINSAYPAAKAEAAERLVGEGVTDPREVDTRSSEAGRQALVGSVAGLTGLTVDHFAEVNLLGFFNLTNAIGGVDVCLNGPVDDDLSGARFRGGPQTVAGHDALAFVRQRHGLPQGDLDRIRRQQAFMAGLSKKMLSAGTLADPITLSRLLDAVKQSVVLDGGWDILRFAQQMQNVQAGNVAFLTIPTQGSGSIDGRGDVVRVDPATVQQFVTDAIGEDDGKPADDGPAPGTIPIDIQNASGAEGAAGRVVAVLSAQGYSKASAGNAEASSPRSEVLFSPGADAAGARVAGSLGGLPTRMDPSVPPGATRVVLASDYRGPGSAPPGAQSPPSSSESSSSSSEESATPAPPPPPAITADGVPCVS